MNKYLKYLNLPNCLIDNESVKNIFSVVFTENNTLKLLNFQKNKITAEGYSTLPSLIS